MNHGITPWTVQCHDIAPLPCPAAGVKTLYSGTARVPARAAALARDPEFVRKEAGGCAANLLRMECFCEGYPERILLQTAEWRILDMGH